LKLSEFRGIIEAEDKTMRKKECIDMAEMKEYIAKKDEKGTISISEEVMASIAGVAALEAEGIASLGTISVTDILGIKAPGKGVRVSISEDSVEINIVVVIKKDFVIPEVAANVQSNVITAIEDMAGVKVSAVNVKIIGVAFEKEAKKK